MSFPDLLDTQNPWWEDPRARPLTQPHQRRVFGELWAALEAPGQRAQVLLGPRQVGKTQLLRQLAERALEAGWPPANVTYFDFKDDRYERSNGLRDALSAKPRGYRDDHPRLLLLDEVTGAPRWDEALKQLVDHSRAVAPAIRDRILVTDSASALVRGGSRESLQGRIDEVRIHGLTFEEALDLQGLGEETSRDVFLRSPGAFDRYLHTGGLPEHVVDDDRTRVWERLRSDLVDRAIARDLSREGVDVERVSALFRGLVQDSGGLFEPNNRARDLETDPRSVRKWAELLASACLIDRLEPWHPSRRRAHSKSSRALRARSKVYAEDHGFVTAFSPHRTPLTHDEVRGRVFETLVFTHLRELRERRRDFGLYFFREDEILEIDFVLEFDDMVLGMETTASKSPDRKLSAASKLSARAGVDRLVVVHGGLVEPRESALAATWPIEEFLLEPDALVERSIEWARRSR